MKFYTYGKPEKPVILLIPGTCCHHSIFDKVLRQIRSYEDCESEFLMELIKI